MEIIDFIRGLRGTQMIVFALMCVVALDYITGLAKAWKNRTIKSRTAKEGLTRKFGLFGVLAIAALIDIVIPSFGGACCKVCALFYFSAEAISVIENVSALGVPVPQCITHRLEQIADELENDNDKNDKEE